MRAERYGHVVSLLLCDLDNFKKINDQYGHHVGDLVIHSVGKTIAACIRKNLDIPVRYGGEEFVILLPVTSLESAKIVGEKIRSHIENLRIVYKEATITITASIGISSSSEGIFMPHELLGKADEKLYAAKEKGKNQVEI